MSIEESMERLVEGFIGTLRQNGSVVYSQSGVVSADTYGSV
jgi:hypothetical protein